MRIGMLSFLVEAAQNTKKDKGDEKKKKNKLDDNSRDEDQDDENNEDDENKAKSGSMKNDDNPEEPEDNPGDDKDNQKDDPKDKNEGDDDINDPNDDTGNEDSKTDDNNDFDSDENNFGDFTIGDENNEEEEMEDNNSMEDEGDPESKDRRILLVSEIDRTLLTIKLLEKFSSLEKLMKTLKNRIKEKEAIIETEVREKSIDDLDSLNTMINDYIRYKFNINTYEENLRNYVIFAKNYNEIVASLDIDKQHKNK